MTENITIDLVTPEALVSSKEVAMVVAPGAEGDFGVLAGHAPLISGLRAGVIELHEGNTVSERVFVTGGFAEVTGERCTILATEAIDLADVTRKDAEARLEAANDALERAKDDHDRARAERKIAEAEVLLEAVG